MRLVNFRMFTRQQSVRFIKYILNGHHVRDGSRYAILEGKTSRKQLALCSLLRRFVVDVTVN